MSMKIHTAYRLKKSSDLWPFVNDTYRRGEEEVKKTLMSIYAEHAAEVNITSEEYKSALKNYNNEEKAKRAVAHDFVSQGYRKSAQDPYRGLFDFDVSLAIRQHKGKLYIVPYADMRMKNVLDFLDKDVRLTDFAYWNNTDMPEGVSSREWAKRRKVWDEMDTEGGWSNHLLMGICTVEKFYKIDPFYDEFFRQAAERDSEEKTKKAVVDSNQV